MIESLSSWFTLTVLFCVLNLMIGTILITSTFRNNNDKKHQQQEGEDHDLTQLPLTPSLLQRVKSVNLSIPDPFSSPLSSTHFTDNYGHSPSLLQRVRSINFSFSSRSAEKPSPFPYVDQDEQPHKNVETITTREEEEKEEDLQCHVTRSKSATCVETTERMLVVEEEVVVVRRRPTTVMEKKVGNIGGGTKSFGDDEAVDRKAEDFISKFREQLKMQRVDSILRYKEMLNRGASI